MELHIPESYIEIDREQFQQLLDSINWQRDACCGGEYFKAKGWEKPYQQRYADGSVIAEMMPRQVAIHTTDNRYFIDPTFFKPIEAMTNQERHVRRDDFNERLKQMIVKELVSSEDLVDVLEDVMVVLVFYGCRCSRTLFREKHDQRNAVDSIAKQAWEFIYKRDQKADPTSDTVER